jgi:acyl-CoA thioesterase-2
VTSSEALARVHEPVTEDLAETLRVESAAGGYLIGAAPAHVTNNNRQVFGGVLLGQAVAAGGVHAGRRLHMLSASFQRGAALGPPLEYEVASQRDGGSYSSRRIVARQQSRVLAEFALSYQVPEQGLEYEDAWSEPPPPDSLPSLAAAAAALDDLPASTRRALQRTRGLEIRPIDFDAIISPGLGRPIRFWVRVGTPLADRADLWAPATAFLTDFLMAGPGVAHHSYVHDPGFFGATLNHTMWLHREVDPSQWLVHEIRSHWTGAGRTLNLGRLFTADGRLAATTAQEALLRRRLSQPHDLSQ